MGADTIESTSTESFDEKKAYDGIIAALQSMQESRRLSGDGNRKDATNQRLQNVALDIGEFQIQFLLFITIPFN